MSGVIYSNIFSSLISDMTLKHCLISTTFAYVVSLVQQNRVDDRFSNQCFYILLANRGDLVGLMSKEPPFKVITHIIPLLSSTVFVT